MTEPAPKAGEAARPGQIVAEARRDAVWHPREASTAQSVAQYSRFVSAMKIALLLATGVAGLSASVQSLHWAEEVLAQH